MIFSFEEFVNESYLKSGRQLLYHYTSYLDKILETDLLKTSQAADKKISISFTRSPYYSEISLAGVRLVLESDKLKIHGYNVVPYDEVGKVVVKKKDKTDKRFKTYSKVNPYIKNRYIINNVGIKPNNDEKYPLEWEYEERIFKDIPNLGKYLVAIDISEKYIMKYIDKLKNYLDKYPHIEVTLLKDNLYDRRTKIYIQKLYQDSKSKKVEVQEYFFV
jgi:hypothetical protein